MLSSSLPKNRKAWIGLVLILVAVTFWNHVIHRAEMQNLFHPEATRYPSPAMMLRQSPFKHQIQDVNFKAKDGTLLYAWYVPPKSGYPTLVFAHGNGGNIADRLYMVELFTKVGYGFLAFDYRGYGNSQGVPSERGLYQDFEAASQYLLTVQHTSLSKQIAMGESLGSGVVVDAASRIHFRAVIIFAALTSTPDVAEYLYKKTSYRFLPFRYLIQQRFDSLSKISKVRSPLIIMHGTNDLMMPLWMPKALFSKARTHYKKLLIIPGAGHNDVLELGSTALLKSLHQLLMQTF